MQRFNKQFKRRMPLTPMVARVVIIVISVVILFIIIRSIVRHSQVIEIRAEYAKEVIQSKQSLITEIDELKAVIDSYQTTITQHRILKEENEKLKAELGRMAPEKGILAAVLTQPNRSFYGTMLIDAGAAEGIMEGQIAYAFDSVAVGTISEVSERTSTVLLYSAPNRETAARAEGSDVAIALIGRGNGDFEVRMPRDVNFSIGDAILYPSVNTTLLAQIEKIVTDPRDPFQRLLAKVPINLTTLKFVIVR